MTKRTITVVENETFCHRDVDFKQLEPAPASEWDNGIRLYGSHACAVLQLRQVGPIVHKGKPRRMIATASYLDRHEVAALIKKLQEILPTLYQG